jgi:hypothetical protein
MQTRIISKLSNPSIWLLKKWIPGQKIIEAAFIRSRTCLTKMFVEIFLVKD